jgi:hypothetical protein
MPAAWCEPLSFLQRITENIAYGDLIYKASEQENACKRMEYIAAFAVSSISNNIDRLSKPFNPVLGETYELNRLGSFFCVFSIYTYLFQQFGKNLEFLIKREDLGFRVVCEQVSHHV